MRDLGSLHSWQHLILSLFSILVILIGVVISHCSFFFCSFIFYLFIFFKYLFYLFMIVTERERHRDTGRGRSRLHAPGAQCGIRSRISRIVPWAKGRHQTAAPPRDPHVVLINLIFLILVHWIDFPIQSEEMTVTEITLVLVVILNRILTNFHHFFFTSKFPLLKVFLVCQ